MNAFRILACLLASCLIAQGHARSQDAGKETTNSIGMKLVLIPAGKFVMGSPAAEAEREAGEDQHEVAITRPFYLGVYTVTQGQFQNVMGKNPSFFHPKNGGSPDHPAEQVRWHEAREFCTKLSALPEEKKAGRTYRLPSEAEWEYACRASTSTPFNVGDALSSKQANFNGDFPYEGAEKGPFLRQTVKVGSYPPNAWGLYDMHGNVLQWCNDWYDPDYYKKSPKENPTGPEKGVVATGFDSNFYVVVRGGCWLDEGRACRSARRFRLQQSEPYRWTGFRVACDVAHPWGKPQEPRTKFQRHSGSNWFLGLGSSRGASEEDDRVKNELQSVSAAMLSALAALPWWAITWMVLNGTAALLGVAGSVTATAVGGWIAPVLICASIVLIGRSFYVIYVRGIRTPATVVIAWVALVFIVGFWTWQLTMRGGWSLMFGFTRYHMSGRTGVTWVLAASTVCLSACGRVHEPEKNSASSAALQEITLHVPGMIDRQGITWLAWSNVVQEALSGLPGVEKVGVDLKKDLLHIRYDPAKVTREQMLQAIDNLGYEGKIVPESEVNDEWLMPNDERMSNF